MRLKTPPWTLFFPLPLAGHFTVHPVSYYYLFMLYTRACLHTIYSSILHLLPFAQSAACPPTCSFLTTALSAVNFAFHSLVLTLALRTIPPQVSILASHWHRHQPSLLLSKAPEFSPQSRRFFPTSAAVLFFFSPTDIPDSAAWTCLK